MNTQQTLMTSGYSGKNVLYAWGRMIADDTSHPGAVVGLPGDSTDKSSPVLIDSGTTWDSMGWFSGAYPVSMLAIKNVSGSKTLWAWGINSYGQLGTGDTERKLSPVQIGALTTWATAYAGQTHSLAVKTDGTLWAWGDNYFGTLGTDDSTNYSSPVQVGALTTWSKVYGGAYSSFAIKTDGTLWNWGFVGIYSILGGTSYSSPVQVGTNTNWSTMSTGGLNFYMGIQTNGTLWGWGDASLGQLALDPNDYFDGVSEPTQIGSLTNWSKISCGAFNSAAIKTNGTLWVWGDNGYGQLGTNDNTSYSSPVQVGALTTWSQVSCGYAHTAAIKTDGTLWAWGDNTYGQLGTNNTTSYGSPVQVGSNTNWSKVWTFAYGTAAIKTTGEMYVFGSNYYSNLGLNQPINLTVPTKITSGVNKFAASKNDYHSFMIKSGSLYGTGYNDVGQIGNGAITPLYSFTQIGTLTTWSDISSNYKHTAAVKTDGTLWIWGFNNYGQLGQGNTTDYSSPVQVGALTTWSKISCSLYHTAAVKTDGTLWAWGAGGGGQLGQGNTTDYSSPVQVGALTTWSKVVAGANDSSATNGWIFAIKTNGTLWAWGDNSYGQLGTNNTTSYSSPVQVGALTTWSKISTSNGYCSAAIKTDGTLWVWGRNIYGELGTGNTTSYSSPVQVGALTTWSDVTCGDYHMIALKTDGTLWGWGYNDQYQLGLNDTTSYSSPVQIGTSTKWTNIYGQGLGFSFAIASSTI